MDTKTLCLGVLSLHEASGYEIKKVFEDAFSHFFPAGFGSIYPALADLERQQLIRGRNVTQAGRPDKRVYAITEAGRHHLVEGLALESPRHRVRSEFLALVFFSHLLTPERLTEVLDERLGAVDRTLAHLNDCKDEQAWPAGARFCRGLGRALMDATRQYIAENRCWLEADAAGSPAREKGETP